jgi:hypothetical protein
MGNMISEKTKLIRVEAASAAGTSTITSDAVDMGQDGGWDGVRFITCTGTITAGAVTTMIGQAASDDFTTDAYDIDNASLSIADDDDNSVVEMDILHPPDRYVRVIIQRTTANSAFGEIVAELYRAGTTPSEYEDTDAHLLLAVVNEPKDSSLST